MPRKILFLTILPALLFAQKSAAPPSYKDLKFPPLGKIEIPNVERFTLPNGMKVYLLEDHEVPVIGGFPPVRPGKPFYPPDKNGLAPLCGMGMRTRGTEKKNGAHAPAEDPN